MNINQIQYNDVYTKAHVLIDNLVEQEGLFIIDKNLNVRVLFYYKDNLLFFSSNLSINLKPGINLNDQKEIAKVCEKILNDFNDNYIRSSKLVKDIDDFIDSYMVDSLVIKINRLKKEIIKIISLEYYNELLLVNKKGIYKIISKDNKLEKIDISSLVLGINSIENIEQILYDIYEDEFKTYPYNYGYSNSTELLESDIKAEKQNSVLMLCNIAAEQFLSFERIVIGKDYYFDDTKDLIESLLFINKDYDVISEIERIVNMSLLRVHTNKEYSKIIN